jgi:sirohydrochlorin ferrochelatase
MKSIILLAHGSRKSSANLEFKAFVSKIGRSFGNANALVLSAFLESDTLTLSNATETAINAGADDILVFPIFLNAGNHVTHDIPAAIDLIAEQYPAVQIHQMAHLGALPGLMDLVGSVVVQRLS